MAEEMQVEDAPISTEKVVVRSGQKKEKKQRSKKFYIILSVLLLLGIVGSIFGGIGYRSYSALYQKDMSSAQAGMEHLRTAENLLKTLQNDPLNAQNISQARKEFTSALSALKQVNIDVQALPGISTSLPVYGSRISAALHLLPLAIELSQTGI